MMKEYQSYNNNELLDLLSKSDEFAFSEIYDRFWQKLFAIAYNRLKEIQTAEDIVHDVLVSLWANRERVTIESLENYLATAAKYMVMAKIKKKERQRIYNNTITPHHAPVFELPIESSLHYKYILEIVKNEVEKLPEKCKLIFKCSRNAGMPVKQIARELNISPKTVENQLNKALKQLKLVAQSLICLLFLLSLLF
ncbi:MAG TPA: RNA polymerase sigma-70 factor [Hanamia sp.]